MTYTLEHLKISYNAGARNLPFGRAIELISLLGNDGPNGLIIAQPAVGSSIGAGLRRPGRKPRVRNADVAGSFIGHGGSVGEKLLEFLGTRGASGAHVQDIADAIGSPVSSVNTWFYTVGKKHFKTGELKKVAPATFAFGKGKKAD